MSKRARSVSWCEGRILDVLGQVQQYKYPTYLLKLTDFSDRDFGRK